MVLQDIIDAGFNLITKVLTPLAFSLCLLYFFWGVTKYIKSEGDGKAEGRGIMVWGVVGLFVAFSIWAIISFIQSELGLQNIPLEVGIQ